MGGASGGSWAAFGLMGGKQRANLAHYLKGWRSEDQLPVGVEYKIASFGLGAKFGTFETRFPGYLSVGPRTRLGAPGTRHRRVMLTAV